MTSPVDATQCLIEVELSEALTIYDTNQNCLFDPKEDKVLATGQTKAIPASQFMKENGMLVRSYDLKKFSAFWTVRQVTEATLDDPLGHNATVAQIDDLVQTFKESGAALGIPKKSLDTIDRSARNAEQIVIAEQKRGTLAAFDLSLTQFTSSHVTRINKLAAFNALRAQYEGEEEKDMQQAYGQKVKDAIGVLKHEINKDPNAWWERLLLEKLLVEPDTLDGYIAEIVKFSTQAEKAALFDDCSHKLNESDSDDQEDVSNQPGFLERLLGKK